jgi:NodT family efflux transporter outer membrane factor (OMF) lipoprotein
MTKAHLAMAAAVALTLGACQSYPVRTPDLSVLPAAYPAADVAGGVAVADQDWTSVVRDPRLARLITLSLTDSRDLRVALLEVQAARAQLRAQDASFFPQVQAGAQHSGTRQPMMQGMLPETTTVGLSLTAFELDLFGRLRAQSQSAFAAYLAAEEGARAARLTLVSAVVEAYLAERAADERLQLAHLTAKDWSASLDLTRRLKQAGQSDGVDLAQAEGQARTAQAELEAAERGHRQALNALALVVGAPLPSDLPAPMALAEQPVLTEIAAGLPSDLLSRRPDILRAEQALKGAQADVRAAKAAFFPTLSLTGQFGFASGDLNKLFDRSSRTWTWTPQITAPLFQGGRLRAQHSLADVRSNVAVANYEKTVQTAFREVADGLAARATYGGQIEAQVGVVAAAERRADLSQRRFRAGVENRIELLDAQRSLYAARQSLIQLRQEQAVASINLYRALGGPMARATYG